MFLHGAILPPAQVRQETQSRARKQAVWTHGRKLPPQAISALQREILLVRAGLRARPLAYPV